MLLLLSALCISKWAIALRYMIWNVLEFIRTSRKFNSMLTRAELRPYLTTYPLEWNPFSCTRIIKVVLSAMFSEHCTMSCVRAAPARDNPRGLLVSKPAALHVGVQYMYWRVSVPLWRSCRWRWRWSTSGAWTRRVWRACAARWRSWSSCGTRTSFASTRWSRPTAFSTLSPSWPPTARSSVRPVHCPLPTAQWPPH